eukprot:2755756-Pyramimonas_sp.AAC.1
MHSTPQGPFPFAHRLVQFPTFSHSSPLWPSPDVSLFALLLFAGVDGRRGLWAGPRGGGRAPAGARGEAGEAGAGGAAPGGGHLRGGGGGHQAHAHQLPHQAQAAPAQQPEARRPPPLRHDPRTVRPGLRRAGPRALPEDAGAAGGRHGARLPAGGARAGAAHVLQAAAAAAIAHGDTRQLHHRLPLAR